MGDQKEFRKFSEKISAGLSTERMMKDIEAFSHLNRYTGSDEGERAAEMIAQRMEELGIPVMREKYRIYRSLPGEASVTVTIQGTARTFALTPYVYSGAVRGLEAELIFDEKSLCKCEQREMENRMKAFKNKIVLTYESSFSFACEAKRAGALGVLTIWRADLAHHGTLGGVWGTPEPEDLVCHYPRIPFAEVCKSDGEEIRELLKKNPGMVHACLRVEMDDRIVSSMMPIARIEGKSKKFVLVSGHYDSWYEGVTDNGVANAMMMELARIFQENQDNLNRSLVFSWWSGHSDGRYSGSTWYYDQHWEELKEDCVAHINLDICGCKGSDLVGFNTSMLEGKAFDKEFLKEFNDEEPIPPVPMARFADQTFWGADVPFAIMPKFSKKNKETFYWWHTKEDSFDKADPEIVLRDTNVIAKLMVIFAECKRLPADMEGFLNIMEERLQKIEKDLNGDFKLSSIWLVFEKLRKVIEKFVKELELRRDDDENLDDYVLKTAGELVRITYTSGSQYHQDPAIEEPMFPGLSMAMGLTRENTSEDYYLAVQTRFVRQRNRLIGQMKQIMESCENIMYRWKMDEHTF